MKIDLNYIVLFYAIIFNFFIMATQVDGQIKTMQKPTFSNAGLQNTSPARQKIIKLQLPGDAAFRDYYVKEDGDYYVLNGDIMIPKNPDINNKSVKKMYFNNDPNCKTCSVTIDDSHSWFNIKNYKWENGMIPIEVAPSVYSSNSCSIVKDALEYMNANTGLIFYPRKEEKDYVSIVVVDGNQGGNSSVGKQGGVQLVKLFRNRFTMYTLCHELMHAAGVYHEQGRKDRDNFINIDINNVTDDQKHNFQIEDNGTSHGVYDYCSIMHYPGYIASMAIDNSKPVITCKQQVCPSCMGAQTGLTDLDKKGLGLFYGQIGVGRFSSNQSFDMGCSGNYLNQKIAAAAMIKLNNDDPDARKFTGGITFFDADGTSLAQHVPGNRNDGDGFFINGYYKESYYYYSMKNGIATAQGSKISAAYTKLGIGNSVLGWPETNEVKFSNGAYQIFNHGYIYSTPSGEAFYITKGPIYNKWASKGGILNGLGWPEISETLLPDGKGYFQRFNHGHIYWSPSHGAFIVSGDIFETWAKQSWERGPLGYPISDYLSNNQGNTKIQQDLNAGGIQKFEHGFIELNTARGPNGQNTSTANVHIYSRAEELGQASQSLQNIRMNKGLNDSSAAGSKFNNVTPKQLNQETVKPVNGNSKMINPQPLPPKVQTGAAVIKH